MIQNDLYTSYDNSDLKDKVFDDDQICKDFDDTSIMFDIELYKSVNSLDDKHDCCLSKADSKSLFFIAKSPMFQSFKISL